MSLRCLGTKYVIQARPKHSYSIFLNRLCWVSVCFVLYNTVFLVLDGFWIFILCPIIIYCTIFINFAVSSIDDPRIMYTVCSRYSRDNVVTSVMPMDHWGNMLPSSHCSSEQQWVRWIFGCVLLREPIKFFNFFKRKTMISFLDACSNPDSAFIFH